MKIKPQFGLAVGISNGGHIRLAQGREETYEEQVILLSPSEAQQLAGELIRLIDIKDDWWSSLESDEGE